MPSGAIAWSCICWWMAVPPSTVKAMTTMDEGMNSTPRMNWRIVRPREILATKTPTNGAQETHQTQ